MSRFGELKVVTFEDYLAAVARYKGAHPEWRMGQTYWNVLRMFRPDLAGEPLMGSDDDPFYTDDRITRFLNYIYNRWDNSA